MENLNGSEDINRAWESIKENIKASATKILGLYEWKQHKPWFGDERLRSLYQRKEAKMQWVQDRSQSKVDNQKNVRPEASKHFRRKDKGYLKAKIDELESNSKIKNIRHLYRDVSDLKKGYQPRTNIVKDEKGDLVTDSHSILARWRYHSLLLIGHRVIDVRRTETLTAQPLVPEPSAYDVEMAIENLKRHKSSGSDNSSRIH